MSVEAGLGSKSDGDPFGFQKALEDENGSSSSGEWDMSGVDPLKLVKTDNDSAGSEKESVQNEAREDELTPDMKFFDYMWGPELDGQVDFVRSRSNDEEFMLHTISRDFDLISMAHPRLRNNIKFMRKVYEMNPEECRRKAGEDIVSRDMIDKIEEQIENEANKQKEEKIEGGNEEKSDAQQARELLEDWKDWRKGKLEQIKKAGNRDLEEKIRKEMFEVDERYYLEQGHTLIKDDVLFSEYRDLMSRAPAVKPGKNVIEGMILLAEGKTPEEILDGLTDGLGFDGYMEKYKEKVKKASEGFVNDLENYVKVSLISKTTSLIYDLNLIRKFSERGEEFSKYLDEQGLLRSEEKIKKYQENEEKYSIDRDMVSGVWSSEQLIEFEDEHDIKQGELLLGSEEFNKYWNGDQQEADEKELFNVPEKQERRVQREFYGDSPTAFRKSSAVSNEEKYFEERDKYDREQRRLEKDYSGLLGLVDYDYSKAQYEKKEEKKKIVEEFKIERDKKRNEMAKKYKEYLKTQGDLVILDDEKYEEWIEQIGKKNVFEKEFGVRFLHYATMLLNEQIKIREIIENVSTASEGYKNGDSDVMFYALLKMICKYSYRGEQMARALSDNKRFVRCGEKFAGDSRFN